MIAMVDRATERSTFGSTVAGLVRYRELLKHLVMKDLKLKYRGSVLGFLWSLVNPLVMISVYAVAFTFIMRTKIEGFAFFLLLGILPWNFFVNSSNMATSAIIDGGGLLKNVRFPSVVLPIATVLFNLAQYLLTIVVFLPVMIILYRVPLSEQMLLYPIFLGMQVLFTMGVALLLAAGTAFFRDIRHLLEIALSILFWLTPIVYQLGSVPEHWRGVILLMPLSPYIAAYQQIFFYHQWPGLDVWAIGAAYAVGSLTAGMAVWLTVEDRLSERV